MTETERTALFALLDRRQARRAKGVPTLSILRDRLPPGEAEALWRWWAQSRGQETVAIHCPERSTIFTAWFRFLTQRRNLQADACARLAPSLGIDAEELYARRQIGSPYDRRRLRESIPELDAWTPVAHACRTLLFPEDEEQVPTLAGLVELLPPQAVPTLLALPPTADEADWLLEMSRVLFDLAEQAPILPIGLIASAAACDTALAALGDQRLGARLREGLIDPASIPVEPTGAESASVRQAIASASTAQESDAARSAAERFLFAYLESRSETAGLFRLNERLDIRFGPAPMEVDLYAPSLRLVIEIDGAWHHLREPASYRRDRRKDWLLQTHGLRVLRVLAEDVIDQWNEVSETVQQAITACRSIVSSHESAS